MLSRCGPFLRRGTRTDYRAEYLAGGLRLVVRGKVVAAATPTACDCVPGLVHIPRAPKESVPPHLADPEGLAIERCRHCPVVQALADGRTGGTISGLQRNAKVGNNITIR